MQTTGVSKGTSLKNICIFMSSQDFKVFLQCSFSSLANTLPLVQSLACHILLIDYKTAMICIHSFSTILYHRSIRLSLIAHLNLFIYGHFWKFVTTCIVGSGALHSHILVIAFRNGFNASCYCGCM